MTRDEYRGEIANPISMHRYAYCANDPVNYVDPMGTNPVYATINGGGGGTSSLGNNYKPELPRLGPMWEVPDLGYTGKAPKPDPKPPAPKTAGTSGTSSSTGSKKSSGTTKIY